MSKDRSLKVEDHAGRKFFTVDTDSQGRMIICQWKDKEHIILLNTEIRYVNPNNWTIFEVKEFIRNFGSEKKAGEGGGT